jgi:O-antigen/teichoic acid export membrane protein
MQGRSQGETAAGAFTCPHAVTSIGLIARGTAQNVLSRGCFFFFGYLGSIILARGLGPVDYGVYGLVMSVLLWVEQTSKFTIPPAAAILIPREEHNSTGLEHTALFLNCVLFITLFVLLWFAAPLLADLFDLHDGVNLFRIAALDLPFFGMYALYYRVLQGHRHFLSISVAELLYSVTKLAGIAFLLALWLSIPGALIVNVLASLGALLFALSRISIKVAPPDWNFIRPLTHFALPLGLYMLGLQTIGSLDLWFLKILNPSKEASTIGIYVAARNVALAPGVVLMVISDVLLPALSRALAQNDISLSRHYVQSGVRFLCIVVLPIVLLFMLTADEMMVLLYSTGFGEGGGLYLKVLIFYAMSLPFIDLFASALNAHGKPYRSGATLFLLIAVVLPFHVLLILSFGPVGAAYASALTGFLGAVTLGVIVYKRFGSLIRFRTFLNAMLAILLTAGIASQLTVTGPLLAISCLGYLAIYVFGLVLLGEITGEDLEPFAFWRSRLT